MVLSSVLGFPRIGILIIISSIHHLQSFFTGANREIKKAVEAYWAGKISADELNKTASTIKKENWLSLKERGVNFIPRYV